MNFRTHPTPLSESGTGAEKATAMNLRLLWCKRNKTLQRVVLPLNLNLLVGYFQHTLKIFNLKWKK